MADSCRLRLFLALFMAALSAFPSPCSSRESCRIEWIRLFKLRDKSSDRVPVLQQDNLTVLIPFDPSKVIQLSWQPRVFFYEKFLSDEDCDHLIALAQGKLERLVVDASKENSVMYSINVSSGLFVPRGQDEVVSKVEERISSWTFLPKEYGEDMLIEHTPANESYEPHYDYYHDISRLAVAGHRVATVLMYLSTISQGGETIFPHLELKHTQTKDRPCEATGYAVKPVKGSAILFFNLHPDATPDAMSLHSSCSVLDGEKWTATKWIHVRNFNLSNQPMVLDEECTDEDDNCASWASMGECEKNAVYMLGTPDYYGSCRKSCGAC